MAGEAGARWMLWIKDVDPEVVRLSLFIGFVNGMLDFGPRHHEVVPQ
jgi:hypothetical protein